MHNYRNDIERIMKKGFAPLPVDDAGAAKTAARIILDNKRKTENRKTAPFRTTGSRWMYALAATAVLCIGAGYLLLHDFFAPVFTTAVSTNRSIEKPHYNVSIVSVITDSGLPQYTGREFATGERSQLLLAVGIRTRTIVFERSGIKIDRTDSAHTIVAMHHGTIAVDVDPYRGADTVTVITPYGSFTQIGTRFSVQADSIRGTVRLEVYRGSVRVQMYSAVIDTILQRGQAWESDAGGHVAAIDRSIPELEAMEQTFTSNKIEHLLDWNTGLHRSPPTGPGKIAPAGRRSTDNQSADTNVAADSRLSAIVKMAERNDFNALDSAIRHLREPSVADTVALLLLSAAERKKSVFQFPYAKRLFDLLAASAPFPVRRREDASMRSYMLHKEHIETAPEELLKMTSLHRRRFPDGAFVDDMTVETIALLLTTHDYNRAVMEMQRFLQRYPRSPHSEYFTYVYASTLRENLQRIMDALAAYKRYTGAYPGGKYEEDALYRIIQLSRSTHDTASVNTYTKDYLEKYPSGRWVETLRQAPFSVRVK